MWYSRKWLLSKNLVKEVLLKQELTRKQPPPLWAEVIRNGFSLKPWVSPSEMASHLLIFTKKSFHFLENKNVSLDQILLFPVSLQLSREYGQAELLLELDYLTFVGGRGCLQVYGKQEKSSSG